jgi:hypothetical protein
MLVRINISFIELYRFNSVAKIRHFFKCAKEIEKFQEKFTNDIKNF